MREILFRGKRKDNGEWVYGVYYKQTEYYGNEQERHYIITSTETPEFDQALEYKEVIPTTIGQYTGLQDASGKRIFEGDIVESRFTKLEYLVCFGEYTYTDEYGQEESACGWFNEDINGYATAFGCPEEWATVIGTIHDNPELLEVQK